MFLIERSATSTSSLINLFLISANMGWNFFTISLVSRFYVVSRPHIDRGFIFQSENINKSVSDECDGLIGLTIQARTPHLAYL